MIKVRLFCLGTLVLLLAVQIASGQKKEKPWSDWSKKDAEKMLTESPWAKTQTDTESTQVLFSRTIAPSDGNQSGNLARMSRGAVDREVQLRFHVRFFSARPVRQALVKILELENPAARNAPRLKEFAEAKPAQSIVVTVSFESNEQAYLASTAQALNGGTTAILGNKTYLERSDGTRLFLQQYIPPGKDGFGARFVFSREFEGAPFLNEKSGEVRFHAEFPIGLLIDRRFTVSEMIYKGELEF